MSTYQTSYNVAVPYEERRTRGRHDQSADADPPEVCDRLRATYVALLVTLPAPLAVVSLVIGIAVTWVPLSVMLIVRDPRNGAEGACIS
jgi:hypothetical protein